MMTGILAPSIVATPGAADSTCAPISLGLTDNSPSCSGANACNGAGSCVAKGCTFYVGSSYGGASLVVPAGTTHADLGSAGFGDKLSSQKCSGGAKVQADAVPAPVVRPVHPGRLVTRAEKWSAE